jgi:RNA polymerase sigma-70 factor, ECF subfamily
VTVTLRELAGGSPAFDGASVQRSDFGAFYAEHWSDVAGFCAALTGSATSGDDIAQEAFTRVCARWQLVSEPRPYVFRIARNLANRHRRGTSREVLVDSTPNSLAIATGVDAELLSTVRGLPERLCVVVLLHYYVDLPIADVATTLRRPVGSVKRQLNEARALLAATMGAADA